MDKFCEEYNQKELLENMNNKYLLFFKHKIDNEILISSKYEIVIRNVNKIEKYILAQALSKRICEILKLSKKLTDFLDEEKIRKIQHDYVKKFYDYDENTIISFDSDGYNFNVTVNKIIEIITMYINDFINETDYEMISKKIAYNYLENFIVLYSKNDKKIYQLIKENTSLEFDDIDWHGRYDEFIFKYFELWNAINFEQHQYLGIRIKSFNTRLKTILDIRVLEEMEIYNECIAIFKKTNFIDIENEKLLYFIIDKFNSDYYLNTDNKILLYFSLIELLITHKPKNKRDSIVKQLKKNIVCCMNRIQECKSFNINNFISEKEIGLLYDYRSILVHGEFKESKRTLKKLEKQKYFQEFIARYKIIDDEFKESSLIDIVRSRVLEIFSCIYKLMVFDDKFVSNLKASKFGLKMNFFRKNMNK